jgi:hypothetical protein
LLLVFLYPTGNIGLAGHLLVHLGIISLTR